MVRGKETEEEKQLGKVDSVLSLRGACPLVLVVGVPEASPAWGSM